MLLLMFIALTLVVLPRLLSFGGVVIVVVYQYCTGCCVVAGVDGVIVDVVVCIIADVCCCAIAFTIVYVYVAVIVVVVIHMHVVGYNVSSGVFDCAGVVDFVFITFGVVVSVVVVGRVCVVAVRCYIFADMCCGVCARCIFVVAVVNHVGVAIAIVAVAVIGVYITVV